MIFFILLGVILFHKTLSVNKQPWPLKIEHIGKCCDLVISTNISIDNLQDCIDIHTRDSFNRKDDVTILNFAVAGSSGSFAIHDIMDFAVLQRAIIAAYAETNNYRYQSISISKNQTKLNHEFQTNDYRWYKIKLLIDALDPISGWGKSTNYIVWVDADAIILDFSLDIKNIGELYPLADIIASADIRMGLINTGFMIIRNTPWLRRFLYEWYYDTVADKNTVCDQDAFDLLYSRYLQREKKQNNLLSSDQITSKVKVLPMNALNSHPPAMLHQSEEDPVLHLMGEVTSMRSAIFLKGLQAVCTARSGGILPNQLGLKRDVILAHAQVIYKNEVQTHFMKANASVGINSTSLATSEDNADDEVISTEKLSYNISQFEDSLVSPLKELSKAAHHYCDILNHMYFIYHTKSDKDLIQQERQKLRYTILQLVLDKVTEVRHHLIALDEDILQHDTQIGLYSIHSAERLVMQSESNIFKMRRNVFVTILLQLLKLAAEAGNDLFGAISVESNLPDKLNTAQLVFNILDELFDRVEDISKVVPLHMKALMHQSLGLLHYEIATSFTEQSHNDNNNNNKPTPNKISSVEFSSAHMHESYQQLKASVSIFELYYFENITDGNALMEISYSMQLLAGVACSMNKYIEGTRIWDRSIAHARASLHGIKQGIRYDNLAVVLYNAAICNNDANKTEQAILLSTEALSIINTSITSSTGRGGESVASFKHNLLHTVTEFNEKLKGRFGTNTDDKEIAASMRAVQTPNGGIAYIPLNKVHAVDKEEEQGKEEEELWVECGLDEDCESFYVAYDDDIDDEDDNQDVYKSSIPSTQQQQPQQPQQEQQQHTDTMMHCSDDMDYRYDDPLAGLDLSGMTEEDILDLKEVRMRYHTTVTCNHLILTTTHNSDKLHSEPNIDIRSATIISEDHPVEFKQSVDASFASNHTCFNNITNGQQQQQQENVMEKLIKIELMIHRLLDEIQTLQADYKQLHNHCLHI